MRRIYCDIESNIKDVVPSVLNIQGKCCPLPHVELWFLVGDTARYSSTGMTSVSYLEDRTDVRHQLLAAVMLAV